MSCESCRADPIATVYYKGTALGINVSRHSALYRCPACGALYEVFPEEKVNPQEIAESQAQELFPSAFGD
jgi:hypothetical protein